MLGVSHPHARRVKSTRWLGVAAVLMLVTGCATGEEQLAPTTSVVTPSATGATIANPAAEFTNAEPLLTSHTDVPPSTASTITSTPHTPREEPKPAHPELAPSPTALATAVAAVEARYGGSAGLAIALPGGDARAQNYGSFLSGAAWSTSKVPIAIAVARQQGAVPPALTSAITVSDNEAAKTLWASLGSPAQAQAATGQVLRDAGDYQTVMQTQQVYPPYTPFGQTQWSVRNQAVFAANLQCIAQSGQIATLMGHIAPDQSYGLGTIAGAHFKGGWGPDPAGAYLVRQMGFIPGAQPGTFLGVALAAQPGDGSYESGQAMLNELAAILRSASLPGGTCSW